MPSGPTHLTRATSVGTSTSSESAGGGLFTAGGGEGGGGGVFTAGGGEDGGGGVFTAGGVDGGGVFNAHFLVARILAESTQLLALHQRVDVQVAPPSTIVRVSGSQHCSEVMTLELSASLALQHEAEDDVPPMV